MTSPSKKADDSPKKLSRGRFLRDSAITVSSIALFPSILTSCKKDTLAPVVSPLPVTGGGLGGTQTLTLVELQKAAANLTRMREWLTDLYPLTIEYELAVFELLDSTKNQQPKWSSFIGKVFIDIAAGIAAALGILNGASLAIPAIALLGNILKDWGFGINAPADLAGTFGEFVIGHNRMQFALEQKLSSIVDPKNGYENLRTWVNPIEFNRQSYTLQDLVAAEFPTLGDHYNKLQDDAYTHFKKSIWNLVIMKCCTYSGGQVPYYIDTNVSLGSLADYARGAYRENKGTYIRARDYGKDQNFSHWIVVKYDLGLNGSPLPDKAVAVLFKDDTPEHIINSDGLFNRSYVFQQFSLKKHQFSFHELASWPASFSSDFAKSDDWDFTGGLFPSIITK